MTTAPTLFENSPAELDEVLRCYKPHCRYLKSLAVTVDGDRVIGTGTFSIPEPCYIDDTGHLNAVEVGICYNQLLYQTMATMVRHATGPVLADWTMDEFLRRYLPDVLIADSRNVFRRAIGSASFSGEFVIDRAARYRPGPDRAERIALETSYRFWDERGGACDGEIRVVVLDTGATA
ncbi:FcoT family thioesterase [Nocardia sp. CDC153]|uniref:FcoT family thioesterase n=1 Tax=Nocardia sp. CDC153 TaxID=3112167 RepID=UPI002DBCDAEE|nr:FcoT family thioesterase [Nocardia sp. CDC153]MEC3954110.1 FcoT family thioesterase [Nocardia sp. CDC153]